MLSTATLDGAHASTRLPRATSCRMYSTTVVVLPAISPPPPRSVKSRTTTKNSYSVYF
jgi:hypothetical protein